MDQYSEAEVRAALEPYHAAIWSSVASGYSEWLAIQKCRLEKGFGQVLYPRTTTNYVFDAIARNARQKFAANTTVRILDESQTVKFIFGGKVIGRFKKGDDDCLGQNQPTQAVMDFISAQTTFPGLPPESAKVEFVWTADVLGSGIEAVTVVARDGSRALWSYNIDDAQDNSGVVLFPTNDYPEDGEPLVKPKSNPKEKSAD